MLPIIEKDKKELIASISIGSFFLDASALMNLVGLGELLSISGPTKIKIIFHGWHH